MRKLRLAFFILLSVSWFSLTVAAEGNDISLGVGESKVITVAGLTRVSTVNPNVVEVVVTGSEEILLNAKSPGLSVVDIWSGQGLLTYRITVQENYAAIEKEIARLINDPNVSVVVNQKYAVLSGAVEDSLKAEEAVQYAKMYRENVINNLEVKVKYQILLSIVVSEIQKDAEKEYGFHWGSWVSTTDGVTFNEWQWATVENSAHSVGHYPGNWAIGSMLEAMEKKGDAKILAAPSILTVSGKEASFLAGGEIPIPISDGDKVTVEWKEYGVKLRVTANLARDNMVAMAIAPEVSSLDWANSVTVEGYKMPAIATRKTATNLSFKEGSTLVIGGLLKKEDSVTVYKLPILGDLPMIGSLFRSKEFQEGNTELLFFVTPKIISDGAPIDPKALVKEPSVDAPEEK